MARRRNVRKNSSSAGKSRQNRSRRQRRRQRKSTVGQLISSGVRTMVGFLPGASYFKNIADFALKAINVASSVSESVNDLVVSYNFNDVHNYGQRAMFLIGSRNLIVSSSVGVRLGTTTLSGHAWRQAAVDFDQVFTKSVTLVLSPEGQMQNRAGLWHFGFQPAYDADSAVAMQQYVLPPEPDHMRNFTRYAFGPADKPLRLNWKVLPSDGSYCNSYRPPASDVLGLVCIYYEDHSRDIGGDMQNSEFACSVRLSGTFSSRNTRPTSDNAQPLEKIVDSVSDRLPHYGCTVKCNGIDYHVAPGYTHSLSGKTYRLTGDKFEKASGLSLDALAME